MVNSDGTVGSSFWSSKNAHLGAANSHLGAKNNHFEAEKIIFGTAKSLFFFNMKKLFKYTHIPLSPQKRSR